MRFFGYFIFIFLLLPLFVFAGDISQITFTNDPQTVKPNEAALLTIHLEYSGDAHPTACMMMSSDSSTAQFSSNGTTWDGIDKLTINSNWSNKNFYYKNSIEGNYVLTVKVVPVSCSTFTDEEAQWTVTQNIIVSSQAVSLPSPTPTTSLSSSSSTTPAPVSSSNNSGSVPAEPKPTIKAYAGKDKVVVVGVLTEFRGMGYGYDEKPLNTARYLWNFGDGIVGEGQNISHYYEYPGEYVAVLDVSSGKESVIDTLTVRVIPNEIFISEIKPSFANASEGAASSFVELGNNSGDEINISRWILRAGFQNFVLPSNTFIRPHSFLVFSGVVSGLVLGVNGGKIELLYPGASVADSFLYSGVLGENQSFSRGSADKVVIGAETPGGANEAVKTSISTPLPRQIEPTQPSISIKKAEYAELKELNVAEKMPSVESQEAGIISVVGKENKKNTGDYILIVSGLALVCGAGVLLVRRQGGV